MTAFARSALCLVTLLLPLPSTLSAQQFGGPRQPVLLVVQPDEHTDHAGGGRDVDAEQFSDYVKDHPCEALR